MSDQTFHPIAEGPPDSERPVLVLVQLGDERQWMRAEWLRRFSREDQEEFMGDLDYKEDDDEGVGYWPAGWYEAPLYEGYDTQNWRIPTDSVLGWRELPPLPEVKS